MEQFHNATAAMRIGGAGADVTALQLALAAAGWPSGTVDGRFGAETLASLTGFQRQHGLLADGFAGALTLAALDMGVRSGMSTPSGRARLLTVADVQSMFPLTPRLPIARNLPGILAALAEAGLADPRMVLVALATVRAETEGFEPIAEAVSTWNTTPGCHAFILYDGRGDLGNRGAPDGATFRGRGYVQLTGRCNYQAFGQAAGVPDLVAQPWRACAPDVAARLLASFLKTRETAISAALEADDLAHARRLVNGGSHGLRRFTEAYRTGERLLTTR